MTAHRPGSPQAAHRGGRKPSAPYRIELVGGKWHVTRPNATMDHAFDELEEAEAFVRHDSSGDATFVEVIVGTVYMFKKLRDDAGRAAG